MFTTKSSPITLKSSAIIDLDDVEHTMKCGATHVFLSYLILSQLFQVAVICMQFLQTLVNWLSEWLQDALTQSSFYDVLCTNT